ncbi:MAG: GNAT family N-acetyltransferase [Acidimicrobiales bacterium]
MFTPLRTGRLVLRRPQLDDLEALVARRNEPEVARFQSWSLPYRREAALELLTAAAAMEGPVDDGWWMATVALAGPSAATGTGGTGPEGEIVGDVAVRLSWGRRCAEIGVTMASAHQGRGLATEAVGATIDHLLATEPVTRIEARLHPDNHPSARLVERLGFLYEGRTRLSFWEGEGETAVNSDDLIYGLTRDDRREWIDRPRHRPDEVELVEITEHNLGPTLAIHPHRSQERLVSSVAKSLADAYVPETYEGAPVVPWPRLIVADGEPAGFVMLALVTDHHPDPFLWRLLVDRRHQGRGIGHRVLDVIEDRLRAEGATRLFVSYVPGPGSPGPFYTARGFVPTGNTHDGEIEAVKALT